MAIITNAEAFRYYFGFYATELWQMKHETFLKWLNEQYKRERVKSVPIEDYLSMERTVFNLSKILERTVTVVRCKDCIYHEKEEPGMVYCPNIAGGWVRENFFCADGDRGL